MRVASWWLVLGVATAASAAAPVTPPPAPTSTWADWVGDWHGKLAWTSCIVDGARAATVHVEATDGAVTIDLAQAGEALGVFSLVEDEGGWLGQHGDVVVHLTRAHGDALALSVDLASGCALRATLHRASVGIAGCDRLVAWSSIEARCTKLVRPPLENPARLARQEAAWSAARDEARDRVATQCDARAGKVETELVDAGCAPNPDPRMGLRGAECQALRQGAAWLGRCGRLPPDVQAQVAQEVMSLSSAAQSARDAELPVVEAQCRELRSRIVAAGRHAGCPP
jgi:hypothetical protein